MVTVCRQGGPVDAALRLAIGPTQLLAAILVTVLALALLADGP